MSFTASGGSRTIQAGDTPTLDDLGVSIGMAASSTILKGTPCFIVAGLVTPATVALANLSYPPCVPTEDKDNSAGIAGALEIRVVTPGQVVALTGTDAVLVGQYVTIGATSTIKAQSQTTDPFVVTSTGATAISTLAMASKKFARYIGKEYAKFEIGTTPFDQILTSGAVPDETLAATEIGWFQLTESLI